MSGWARQWAIWRGARSEQGQTMAEYATLLAILIIAVVGALDGVLDRGQHHPLIGGIDDRLRTLTGLRAGPGSDSIIAAYLPMTPL